jgi:serine/threonine-protein kinase HipA
VHDSDGHVSTTCRRIIPSLCLPTWAAMQPVRFRSFRLMSIQPTLAREPTTSSGSARPISQTSRKISRPISSTGTQEGSVVGGVLPVPNRRLRCFRDAESRRFGIPRDSTPTNVILKPAIAGYAQHHVNEALCLRAAGEVGLLAAKSEVVEIADVPMLVSTRYDRFHDGTTWHRVHQEDMCQALSVHPSLKYQSDGGPAIGDIADLLNRLPIEDRGVNAERFFKALTYNVLIGGTDAHAKNYSLVLIGSRAQVSPLYDVASAAPYDQREPLRSAMKIGEHWKMLDVNNSDWVKVGRRLGIAADQAVDWVAELRAELPGAFERVARSLPTNTGPEAQRTAERIVDHIAGTWTRNLNR